MSNPSNITPSRQLQDVRYEIRGRLGNRAHEMELEGHEILSLNIGNPGLFGLRTPESMRLAMIENLEASEAYCPQRGVFPAREAVVMQQQERGIMDAKTENVFIGNGVSELIDLSLRALLNPGDEVLIPSPDYPLWTAATLLNGGKAIHYPCPEENNFSPDISGLERLITTKTRALVVINPNNPTGAVYSQECLASLAKLAEKHELILFSDEIYDQMVYDDAQFIPLATLCEGNMCATFSGLSKVYRACGYRVGWVSFSGALEQSKDYLAALDLLAALRLCSNVPGQWAVQTALGGHQSINQLCGPGGRLYESRSTIVEAVEKSRYLHLKKPRGAMYAFIGVNTKLLKGFDDEAFALDLLEQEHVLVAPGSSFNTQYRDHFRITTLPGAETLVEVFKRVERILKSMASK